MAAVTQCDNCGAVLAKEDLFCGECGAPRPHPGEVEEPSPGAPTTPATAPPLPTPSSGVPQTGWRVTAVVLVVLGLITCMVGVLAFLFAGSLEYESLTGLENWLVSALMCLLPIGGAGVFLLAISGIIWYTRLRQVQ